MKKLVLIPLALFIVLVIFLFKGLWLNPREVPSQFIGKPAPMFDLPQLGDPSKNFSPKDMLGQVWLLNVWASWCVSCREEHPLLVEIARSGAVPIYGLSYKDKREDGLAALQQMGDPYVLSASDFTGRVGIDYGVYGVPESYLIDKAGIVRYKVIGPLTPQAWQEKVLPMIKELQR
jgi:cytochrome c biogenesis protein CcmG/thiol:disulfide interchange protein DsbE